MITNNEKQDCIESIVRGLERTSAWRKAISANFNDPRNMRAVATLDQLAIDAARMNDAQWASLKAHYAWTSLAWRNSLTQVTRQIGFLQSASGLWIIRYCACPRTFAVETRRVMVALADSIATPQNARSKGEIALSKISIAWKGNSLTAAKDAAFEACPRKSWGTTGALRSTRFMTGEARLIDRIAVGRSKCLGIYES